MCLNKQRNRRHLALLKHSFDQFALSQAQMHTPARVRLNGVLPKRVTPAALLREIVFSYKGAFPHPFTPNTPTSVYNNYYEKSFFSQTHNASELCIYIFLCHFPFIVPVQQTLLCFVAVSVVGGFVTFLLCTVSLSFIVIFFAVV